MENQQQYWDSEHLGTYRTAEWSSQPSHFATGVLLDLPKRARLLDLGTGQGRDAAFFKRRGYDVVGTDFSETAIAAARERYPDIAFQVADTGQPLPFEDASFEVVYSHLGLHYFDGEGTSRVFRETHRVLKPGGMVAALVNSIDDPEVGDPSFTEIEPGCFRTPDGLLKHYFSTMSLLRFVSPWFRPRLLDAKGVTHKDPLPNLIRLVGIRCS
jgi:tellurite methyltransferase